ncbi:MAG: hypothetical protein LUD68_03915, partial [Rikenellaceae bacterium]|nr:hypothetical protein [Rikenellaceae bacterium]
MKKIYIYCGNPDHRPGTKSVLLRTAILWLFLVSGFAGTARAQAQSEAPPRFEVTAKVLDEHGQPLAGAQIVVLDNLQG